MIYEDANYLKYVVKISYKGNFGSGVAFNVDDKAIVITAYHNFADGEQSIEKDRIEIERTIDDHDKKVDFEIEDIFISMEYDFAVLSLKSCENFYGIRFAYLHKNVEMFLCGYPFVLSDSKYTHTWNLRCALREVKSKRIIAIVNDKLDSTIITEKDAIVGFSGGGFYIIEDGMVCLCGIETCVLERNVTYNAVAGVSIEAIIDVLNVNGINTDSLLVKEEVSRIIRESDLAIDCLATMDTLSMDMKSDVRLESEYGEGIDAHPEHIRRDIDIRRDIWLKRIDEAFVKENIVVIKGASGQGKTSLAYRFLKENYAENQVLILRRLDSDGDIRIVIRFMQTKLVDCDYIIYYDIQPGDNCWVRFLQYVYEYGIKVPILVTVREDDYNRGNPRTSRFCFGEITLGLMEEEAKLFFQRYKCKDYLSFEDSWGCFGGKGPLLEYIYMLNHSITLEDRIDSQIMQIYEGIDDRDWYMLLGIIAIAGQYDLSIRVDRLFDIISVNNVSRVLQYLEQEFWIRVSNDRNSIRCLHAVRAKLILKALKEKIGFDYSKAIISTLSIIDRDALLIMLEYTSDVGVNADFINDLSRIQYNDLSVIEDVLRSLLWNSIVEFQIINNEVIEEGYLLSGGNIIRYALGDITGFLDTQNTVHELWQIMELQSPGITTRLQTLVDKLKQKKLKYDYERIFLNDVKEQIVKIVADKAVSARNLGFLLYWYKLLDVSIQINTTIRIDDRKDYIGIAYLIKGLIAQNMIDMSNGIKDIYQKEIFKEYSIISFKICDNEAFAEVIPYSFGDYKDDIDSVNMGYHDICMLIVDIISSMYPGMKKYNVNLLGTDIANIKMPDIEKHIPAENIHERWITELNGIGCKLLEYKKAPADWQEVFDNIENYRIKISELLETIIKQFSRLSKNKGIDVSKINMYMVDIGHAKGYELPQCALDRFGISYDNANKDKKQTPPQEQKIERKKFDAICKDYFVGINNYINFLDKLLADLLGNQKNENIYNLALYNIVSAYEKYRQFSDKCESFFAMYSSRVDKEHEKKAIEQVVALTYWLYENSCLCDNVVYQAHEMFKKEIKKVDRFLEVDIKKINGISKTERSGYNIAIYVEEDSVENAINSIYDGIQMMLNKERACSPIRGYLYNIIDCISLIVTKDSFIDYMSIDIPIKDFAIARDYEQLHKFLIAPKRKVNVMPPEKTIEGAVLSMMIIISQICQIDEALEESSDYTIEDTVLSVDEMIKIELQEIIDKLSGISGAEEIINDIYDIKSIPLISSNNTQFDVICERTQVFIEKYCTNLRD